MGAVNVYLREDGACAEPGRKLSPRYSTTPNDTRAGVGLHQTLLNITPGSGNIKIVPD